MALSMRSGRPSSTAAHIRRPEVYTAPSTQVGPRRANARPQPEQIHPLGRPIQRLEPVGRNQSET
jgi:hypothetical protein